MIEDKPILRENTAELLELSNLGVRTACNGKLGAIAAEEYLPHLIVCDIMIPELDGFRVMHALSKDENTKRPLLFFYSPRPSAKTYERVWSRVPTIM